MMSSIWKKEGRGNKIYILEGKDAIKFNVWKETKKYIISRVNSYPTQIQKVFIQDYVTRGFKYKLNLTVGVPRKQIANNQKEGGKMNFKASHNIWRYLVLKYTYIKTARAMAESSSPG